MMIDLGVVVPVASAVAAPLFTYLGIRVNARKSRLELDNQLETKKLELERGAKEASAKAAAETTRAITADWQAYTASLMQDREVLLKRLETVEQRAKSAESRLDTAEDRAVIAEERAIRWESLYRIAVAHMRKLVAWASDISHMSDMPEPPAELIDQL